MYMYMSMSMYMYMYMFMFMYMYMYMYTHVVPVRLFTGNLGILAKPWNRIGREPFQRLPTQSLQDLVTAKLSSISLFLKKILR